MRNIKRLFKKSLLIVFVIFILALIWARFLPISTTPFMYSEAHRLNGVRYEWVNTDELPKFVATSVMAGEDAYFCEHHGVEWDVLLRVILEGGKRGGSTISQQMVKNLWLWHGAGFFGRAARKLVEIPMTLLVELIYPKSRIMELYLNIVEFDEGVFGIEAAAWHHYRKPASALNREEMSRLAAVLPNPAIYSAVPPDNYVKKRAAQIAKGARDIEARGLDNCI